MTVDHIVPLSKGGANEMENYAAACEKCNTAKASLTESEFRAKMADGTAFIRPSVHSAKHKAFMRAVAEIRRKRLASLTL